MQYVLESNDKPFEGIWYSCQNTSFCKMLNASTVSYAIKFWKFFAKSNILHVLYKFGGSPI